MLTDSSKLNRLCRGIRKLDSIRLHSSNAIEPERHVIAEGYKICDETRR